MWQVRDREGHVSVIYFKGDVVYELQSLTPPQRLHLDSQIPYLSALGLSLAEPPSPLQ